MPRYYFHMHDDVVTLDEGGMELPDLAAAKYEAVRGARSMMAEELMAGRPIKLFHRIEIADDDGKVLAAIPFREVITVQE
jgi:hypothetical protein